MVADMTGIKDELKCGVCGELTNSVLKFLQHKTTHVDRGVKRGCEICQLAFSRQAGLCEHYKRKHSVFFDTYSDSPVVHVKREKRQLREKVKVATEKEKSEDSITHLIQQTTATVNLPNGVKLNVVVDNTGYNTEMLNDPEAENEAKSLSEDFIGMTTVTGNGNDTEDMIGPGATVLTDDETLLDTTFSNAAKTFAVSTATHATAGLNGSASVSDSLSALTGSHSLSGFSTFSASAPLFSSSVRTDSSKPTNLDSEAGSQRISGSAAAVASSLIGTRALTGSVTHSGSTLWTSPIILSDTIAVSSTTSLFNINHVLNTQNKDILEAKEGIDEKISKIDQIEKRSHGARYIIERGLVRKDADKTTGSYVQLSGDALAEANLEQVEISSEKEIFIPHTLNVESTEVLHSNKTEADNMVLSEVDQNTDDSVIALENRSYANSCENAKEPGCEGISSAEAEMKTKNNVESAFKNTVSLKQSPVTTVRELRKKPRLTPVAGKIPQELDMPDFYFLNIVTLSGTHRKNMHAGKDQFKCLFCSIVTKWRGSMCRHMREVHSELLESGAASVMPSPVGIKDGKVMKMTEYIQMEIAKKPTKRMRGVESQDLPGDFPCEQCGKVFNRLRYLRMHLQQHKLKKDFLCSLCSKTFKTKNNLNQHLKTHQEREPYKCPECDFESSVNIAIHKHRQIHNAGSLLCDICGQAYSDKSTLKKHKQVHDPSRPWGCTIPGCTWRFKTKQMCDAHIQGHGSKPTFKCDLCGYSFRQKHHLQRHEKVVHNIVYEQKPAYRPYFTNADSDYNDNHFENISNDDQNEMEVSHGVNVIIDEGNMSNVITTDHFDLESALQNGHLVIAADDGNINYEMSDIGSNVVYQTFLPDGEVQHFETQTVSIPQSDEGHVTYEELQGVEAIQSEVEIEQS